METKYHTLKRPRRKLCYLTNKKSSSKQCKDKLSLEDIDGMFDDLDSSSPGNDISPLQDTDESDQSKRGISPVLQKGSLIVKLPGSGRDILNSARRSLAPELENVAALNVPFKLHEPVKTSSPIEENLVLEATVEEDNERALVVPQVLDFEEPNTDLVTIKIPQRKAYVAEEEVNSELESPPSRVTLSKPTVSSHKKQVATECKQSLPTKEKTPKKPQSLAERKTPREQNSEPSVSAVKQKPEHPVNQPPAEKSTQVEIGMNVFLQRLRNAQKSKPACSRRLQSLVKVPTPPPEPEDEFRILEDDTPFIYIPSKAYTRKSQRPKETKAEQKSTDKDCSVDKGTPDGQIETSVIDFSPGDLVEQERPNKKKRNRKALKQLINRDRKEAEKANTEKLKSKTQKSSDANNLKCLKGGNEKAKKQKKTELKDLSSPLDKEIIGSGAQTGKTLADEKAEQIAPPAGSTGSSSEDSEFFGKRKRKQPGQWWISCPQNAEETKVTDNQPTTKKSKPNKRQPTAELPSPIKPKKDKDLKKINQKLSVPVASKHTNTAADKKKKLNVKRRVETPDKRKTTDVEQIDVKDQQLDVAGQDQVHEDLSPFKFAPRHLSLGSGTKVFQKVYNHVSSENMSTTPASVSTRRPEQQQQPRDGETEKRRRKLPGKWWLVNGVSEDIEHGSPQLQKLHRQEYKPRKERKNQSRKSRSPRLGTPKSGNVAVSSKLQGGTATPSLKLKPLSAPKTVKRSLATFKDIFTSAAETETEIGNGNGDGDEGQNNGPNISSVAEVSGFSPVDSKCQPEKMLKLLTSGPSSMIQLEQYEENDDLILPSTRVSTPLLMSDMCAPPLKPMILQPNDKDNLAEWFKSLWSSDAHNAAEVSPDDFDWYFYRDRALGFLLDANCGSACVGRLLLGSYTKKPLWVDHSALTVFNLITSSVVVVTNGKVSRFCAGQCFTVQCGCAYSIQNLTGQPAVLYFTRTLAEGSD
ncbi:neurofilament heavy polypeptide [Betta splendens]|uniref:Neurofilament heavy polypeptide n=1 Tax=Betta splendens TaxID=158456 RepID=A0A6P7MEH8_BETSP|nr:neurofilament heavy polypeptide [Betta splendens]